MAPIERIIIEFLQCTRLEQLPPGAVHEARRALLDTLGCMIAGLDTPLGRRIIALSRRFGQPDGASVLGVEKNVAPFFAAMGNGFMANALDADDGHRLSRLHAGGVIVPAVLAAVQEKDCSGGRLLEAIVVGYELGLRAGMASTAGDIYFGSAFGSTFGAAAAVGWILGLAPPDIVNAMGISEMHAPNCMLMGWVNSRRIPMIKEGMGWAAATAMMAAHMAADGISGTLTIFDRCDRLSRIDRLGREYEIEHRYYKIYPACRWTQAPLQTLLDMMAENRLTADGVVDIEVRSFDKAVQLDNPAPATIEEAEYSIPYVLGAAMVAGTFGPEQLGADQLHDPHIGAQARKVRLTADAAYSRQYPRKVLCEVIVKTTAGLTYKARNTCIPGDWDHPLTDDQLKDKFARLVRRRLSELQIENLVNSIFKIETQSSVRRFVENLNADVSGAAAAV